MWLDSAIRARALKPDCLVSNDIQSTDITRRIAGGSISYIVHYN